MVAHESMFAGFDTRSDADATRRYSITSGLALVVLAGFGAAAIAFSGNADPPEPEPEVIDVTFQAPVDEPPPPPAPPPPTPRPAQKVVRRDVPRTPTPQAPTQISEEKLEERDEQGFRQDEGEGGSDMLAGIDYGDTPGGLGSTAPPPPPPRPKAEKKKVAKGGPIQLPENATPPKPMEGNARPEFPEDARAAGIEGVVILKIVIEENGSVGEIEVLRGDEPFVSAAVATVKTWKYTPALVDGKPTAIYRTIKVPFKLAT